LNVGVVGATGYSGVELYRLLANHPEVEMCNVYSSSLDKVAYTKIFPHLQEISGEQINAINAEEMKKELDVVFLATPSGISKELVPELTGSKAKVIDLSGDLRLKTPGEYEKWYGKNPASAALLDNAVYGLSEWNQQAIKKADVVANPGCYPTASLLGLAPLVNSEEIKSQSVIIDAKSGLSGAGKKASLTSSFAESQENFRIYKVHQHQHIPEIEQQLQWWSGKKEKITFSTHLVPMTRGIMATMYVELLKDWNTESLQDYYQSIYESSPFVRVRKKGSFPSTRDVYGSNYCDIAVELDERTNRVTIVSVIDNLLKGAAGQAVQNMNLMFGLEETTGLTQFPIYP
jgi:N-acetyl-gamma-glutamyl-phosphate reductase